MVAFLPSPARPNTVVVGELVVDDPNEGLLDALESGGNHLRS